MDTNTLLNERLWTIDDLASYLNVTRRKIYSLTSKQRIPSLRLGKELRFRPSDIMGFVTAHTNALREPDRDPADELPSVKELIDG